MGLENRTCFLVNLRDGLRCRQCGQSPTQQAEYHRGFEYHHVIPRSQGGSDLPENIALLCHACHQGQHARKLAESIAVPAPPETLTCARCATVLPTATVEMNCGWYRCGACGETVHLYQHFANQWPEA